MSRLELMDLVQNFEGIFQDKAVRVQKCNSEISSALASYSD